MSCMGHDGEVPLARRSTGARGTEFGGLLEPGLYRLSSTVPERFSIERLVYVEAGEEERVKTVLAP